MQVRLVKELHCFCAATWGLTKVGTCIHTCFSSISRAGVSNSLSLGPHQSHSCLRRAEIILGLYKCNYSLTGKELKLHSALWRQLWGWCGPLWKWAWHPYPRFILDLRYRKAESSTNSWSFKALTGREKKYSPISTKVAQWRPCWFLHFRVKMVAADVEMHLAAAPETWPIPLAFSGQNTEQI